MQRLPRLAIATLPGLDHFVQDLARGLAGSGMVDARLFAVRGAVDLAAALDWTDQPDRDAILFEFCWPPFPALIATTAFGGRRVIVRVHRIEAYEADHVARTAWARVTDLVVVSQDMARCVREVRPGLDEVTRVHVIHNGLDLDVYPARGGFNPHRIGWCGAFIARKNPTLALQILYRLRQLEPAYRLHLAVRTADRLTMESFCHQAARLGLGEAVRFDGHVPAAAIPAWHAANGVLLSTSLHESFGYAIAEAAAAGCDLAVLDHLGADEFWPEATRFVSIEDAVRRIGDAAPDRWRDLAFRRFPLGRQVAGFLALLGRPGASHDAAAAAATAMGSKSYWDQRYRCGGDSGPGSGGRLAVFKANFLNRLVSEQAVGSVLELGCGDGRQLALAEYRDYVGVDVSATAVAMCRDRFADDASKRFLLAGTEPIPCADLALSIDVIFHLVEDEVFEQHMRSLFEHARRLVVLYASDRDEATQEPHVRHRAVSAWVDRHARAWERIAHVANPYSFDRALPDDTSFADFHVFARRDATAPAA